MIREIAEIGNPVLRKVVPEITSDEEIKRLKQDLADTLAPTDMGVAIAAPQISEEYRMFYINMPSKEDRPDRPSYEDLVYINPMIKKEFGDRKKMFEGCLSIHGIFAEVERRSKIILHYYDFDGKEHEEEYSGFIARLIQHEYDHLNGILYTDLMDPKSILSTDEYIKMRKKVKKIK